MLKRDIDQFDPDLEVEDSSDIDLSGEYNLIQTDLFSEKGLEESSLYFGGFSPQDYDEDRFGLFEVPESEAEEVDLDDDESLTLQGLETKDGKESGFDGDSYRALVASIDGRVLSKDEEQTFGRTIQSSEHNRQLLIFSNDFVARMCLEPLLMVKNGYREDRILEVSVTNKAERARCVAQVMTNLPTIVALLEKNRELTKVVMNRNTPHDERERSLSGLHKNRRKVALLYREVGLRKKFIDKSVEKLKRISEELKKETTKDLADNLNESARYLTVLRLGESGKTLQKRLDRIDEVTAKGTDAKKTLAEHNIRYVISIAKKFRGQGLSFVDLIQEGTLGLMRATEKFDPSLGWKFSTYCTHWIKQAMRSAISQKSRTIRVTASGITQLQKFRNMKKELFLELNREPNEEETFNRFREVFKGTKKEKKAVELFTWLNSNSNSVSSLDTPFGNAEDRPFGDLISRDNRRSVEAERDEEMDRTERFHQALHVLNSLAENDPRGADIIKLRFGLTGQKAYTLEEVAHHYGVSRERIRQVEGKFVRKMQKRAITLKIISAETADLPS